MFTISRRNLLKSAASVAALGAGVSLMRSAGAYAAEAVTVVEWGGSYIKAMQEMVAKQPDIRVNWILHTSGSAAILPKIKAMWPRPGIDVLTGWDVSWQVVAREGWAEPVTLEKVPNLVDVPPQLLVKDDSGNIVNIPRTVTALSWFYRADKTPFEVSTLDDLLDPRLKGKICFPIPTLNQNVQIVALALHKGGDEKNMEPGWDFMKKLAQSGNIGRVANSDTDTVNSISSGETAITFQSNSSYSELSKNFKMKLLNKMDPKSGFRTFYLQEGWSVLKGGNTQAAFKLVNFLLSPRINGEYNEIVGAIPANIKAPVPDRAKIFVLNNEEMSKHAYVPDWSYMSQQADTWMKRWEQEIQPLL
ncbi:PotD/PotF family extracellular solute-binding protein [Microvirga sp. VF16]|uniref:ABC transporter substrate-binding protein n=1 Tax=Microvirga sp. VF16 TaxID=2807101 RepID=UPI00193CB5CA|nr:extracellular solute-binding protein [Microvirga sp. VF16]QRM32836.1 extracellular solute-binding protein [Microvirga sp. VF16]